jgi:transcription initiation factor TFIID subunit TAF12
VRPARRRAPLRVVAAGAPVGEPGKTIGGRKLTPQEYDDYQRVAGRNLRAGLARWIDTQDWRELSDEERRELISEIADEAREDARYELRLSE